ncbi:hypothetical protein DYGSA30_26390 [Dyella sp. GSA-30]|nr:hypothetical protein DYGSA30_26390 [Dyella sp. GSA-30]
MSFFKIGKYEVRAWEFISSGPKGLGYSGRWSVTDPSVSGEPVDDGECPIERSIAGEALDDAKVAGRAAAEALIAQDGG